MTTIDAAATLSPTDLRRLYEQMVLIRVFETESERQYKAAKIGGYCHLSSGQEAATVGVVHTMQEDDMLVTGYRCHGFALARGVSPEAVMAELFGRADGCAHGRGGSMHLLDVDKGFYGGWGIVGGQLPIATGLALALVRRGKSQAVVCELGDGAINMGAWHESLNLAALWDLPVVFLVVNNGYGMGTSVQRASAEPDLYRRASAFRMHGERVDGDDLEAVVEASDRLLKRAREQREPAVLEVVTYRYRGHSVADAGLAYRTKEEIAAKQAHDPIARIRVTLREHGMHRRGARPRRRRGRRARRGGRRLRRGQPRARRERAGAQRLRARQRRAVRPHAPGQPVRRGGARLQRRARLMSAVAEATENPADDLPRGAAPRHARGARPRRARLHHGRGGRRLRGLLQGHRRPDGRVRARARARHADLRGGLRRRRRRRGDGRRAPDRRDHDDQLPARRDRPGRQPRRQGPHDVRRRGRLPDGHPDAERRRQPAHRAALAVARGLVRAHARA